MADNGEHFEKWITGNKNCIKPCQKCVLIWAGNKLRAYGGCLGFEKRWRTWRACDKRRGGGEQPLIRRCPNGETPLPENGIDPPKFFNLKIQFKIKLKNLGGSVPAEVKHFSKRRKRKQPVSHFVRFGMSNVKVQMPNKWPNVKIQISSLGV